MRPFTSLTASAAAPPVIPTTLNLDQVAPVSMASMEMMARMPTLRFSRSGSWNTWEPPSVVYQALSAEAVGGQLSMRHDAGYQVVSAYEGDGWYAAVFMREGRWSVEVAATDIHTPERILDLIDTLAGDGVPQDPDEVSMAVWTESPMGGGYCRYSSMKVGVWGEVEQNYPTATRAKLAHLAANIPDRSAGGIVMLCGLAGSGKTRAIEALAAAWGREANLGVVVDSDRLLGSASYLADVITSCGSRRQVIVAEDVDEMVVAGPKSACTSKLLNIADGIVGRLAGAGTLLVLTANLALDEIADHVVRPGRAAAVIEFEHFGVEEANIWLANKGIEAEVTKDCSLAELYAISAMSA